MALMAALALLAGCAGTPDAAPAGPAAPKGYVIVEINVTDPEGYEGYRAAVAPMVAEAGGRYLVRGGKAEGREGTPPAGRVVVLEYPSFEAAKAFLDSPQYKAIAHLRTDNTDSRLMIVEGIVP
ncbi:MAG: DUF1330 domain-containing protein [Hyphomonas sp.]|jgi:uncharacterized protein (DUF1330 family)